MGNTGIWRIHIDTGGTFTDLHAKDPAGVTHRVKVLSDGTLRGRIIRKIDPYNYSFEAPWSYESTLLEGYTLSIPSRNISTKLLAIDYRNRILTLEDNIPALATIDFNLSSGEEAPVVAIRLATRTKLGLPFPFCELRLGTTRGTNALLEKKGAKSLLIVTKGFKDLLKIGTQQRPHLFQLNIPQPDLLPSEVFEISERMDSRGYALESVMPGELDRLLTFIESNDFTSCSISLLNAYANPSHENLIADFLRHNSQLFISSAVHLFPQIHYLRRTQTASIDAYLAPIISTYLKNIQTSLKNGAIQVMTSAGGLVVHSNYKAKDSLLSGPAGGIIAATHLAAQLGIEKVLTFDMGGTSTDTARIDRRAALRYITKIEGYELFNPSLAIETVAAGGGSVCWFDGYTLRVGPQSAGANPGPACYGAGGPLTITDVNLLLGKLDTGQFEIPISPENAMEALYTLIDEIVFKTGNILSGQEVLEGLERIANEKMAEGIRRISIGQGVDPSAYALMSFGGAGGLHGCQLANHLNISRVIVPFEAGLFSAVGIGNSQLSRIATKQVLQDWETSADQLPALASALEQELKAGLLLDGVTRAERDFCSLYLRFAGQETSLEVPFTGPSTLDEFLSRYQRLYGYLPAVKKVEIESIRMMVQEKKEYLPYEATEFPARKPTPIKTLHSAFDKERAHEVYTRLGLQPGEFASGPCIITDETSTTFVPENWDFQVLGSKDLILTKSESLVLTPEHTHPEEVELELFTNRFYAIAEEMGVQLQRTAFSVNVKERLDFSCALLDAQAELLVNAPHIPVHLGSMGVCARLVRNKIELGPGDIVITNHPKYGGSHLPDVTLIAGVFTEDQILVGYVMNRAHHAEIGGSRPGSMPPDAQYLYQEGVTILPQYLIKSGESQWGIIRQLFLEADYPTRSWAENEADILAAISSLHKGREDLLALVDRFSLERVHYFMKKLKENAFQQLQNALLPYFDKKFVATEFLDDGHRISVQIDVKENELVFDFKNTSHAHPNNLNANLSIIHSAILYVLRLLVDKEIPLNDGLMQNVKILMPENSLLHPDFQDDPKHCPAVVGGNTEVSQRLVDTLLKAFELGACSQGTMNNFLFGNDTMGYYETIGGGAGAGYGYAGRSAVHQHMTNTRITDTEELERRYPIRVAHFGIRTDSGGKGKWRGGDGVIREVEFLDDLEITLLTQHRYFAPYGMAGGENGKTADETIIRADGRAEKCPGICSTHVQKGDRIIIETPGGGGYGEFPA